MKSERVRISIAVPVGRRGGGVKTGTAEKAKSGVREGLQALAENPRRGEAEAAKIYGESLPGRQTFYALFRSIDAMKKSVDKGHDHRAAVDSRPVPAPARSRFRFPED